MIYQEEAIEEKSIKGKFSIELTLHGKYACVDI
jgi:hypothetical protein